MRNIVLGLLNYAINVSNGKSDIVITEKILEGYSNLESMVNLDNSLGGYGILTNNIIDYNVEHDKIEIDDIIPGAEEQIKDTKHNIYAVTDNEDLTKLIVDEPVDEPSASNIA